jgi:hypothetical protein
MGVQSEILMMREGTRIVVHFQHAAANSIPREASLCLPEKGSRDEGDMGPCARVLARVREEREARHYVRPILLGADKPLPARAGDPLVGTGRPFQAAEVHAAVDGRRDDNRPRCDFLWKKVNAIEARCAWGPKTPPKCGLSGSNAHRPGQ